MTTLIGIKTGKDKEGIILASDLSTTQTSWSAQGDVAYRQQIKYEGQKIYVDDKKEVALCMSGIYDQFYIDFLSQVLNGKMDVRKATKRGYFPEFKRLNEKRWDNRIPNIEYMNGLLLATRFDKPKLYTCWPLGKVEERPWTSVGSGSEYVVKKVSRQEKLIPQYLSLDEGIELAVSSLEEAAQDIYTTGLDIVIVTADEIREFGKEIKAAIDSAKSEVIKSIKRSLTSK